jgi:hypothetical protein
MVGVTVPLPAVVFRPPSRTLPQPPLRREAPNSFFQLWARAAPDYEISGLAATTANDRKYATTILNGSLFDLLGKIIQLWRKNFCLPKDDLKIYWATCRLSL